MHGYATNNSNCMASQFCQVAFNLRSFPWKLVVKVVVSNGRMEMVVAEYVNFDVF